VRFVGFTPNPSRTDAAFLILALSGNLTLGPIPRGTRGFGDANLGCPNNPTPERSRVPATLVLKQLRFQIQFFWYGLVFSLCL
jgi:hypothetical protein